MLTEEEKRKRRKINRRIFPIYRMIGCDFLFFYTINFLFLTQVKGITPAEIVLVDAFYAIFSVFWQTISSVIIDWLGKRKSMILGNLLNCLYFVIIMLSTNIWGLFLAEFVCALAFALKDIAEPSLLNQSIAPSKRSDAIFSKLNGKGLSRYYYLSAIAVVIAGFLYNINEYLPISLALTTFVIATILSFGICEISPEKKQVKSNLKQTLQEYFREVKLSFQFIFKSKRLRALLLFTAVVRGFLSVAETYEISLLEEIQTPSYLIGIISAILGLVAGFATAKQQKFHECFRNRTLSVIGITLAFAIFLAGGCVLLSFPSIVTLFVLVLCYSIRAADNGLCYSLPDRYLRNFADDKIVSKIYASKEIFNSLSESLMGIGASCLLGVTNTAIAMTLLGGILFFVMLMILTYMKTRVGLKPEEYPKEEIDYAAMK